MSSLTALNLIKELFTDALFAKSYNLYNNDGK